MIQRQENPSRFTETQLRNSGPLRASLSWSWGSTLGSGELGTDSQGSAHPGLLQLGAETQSFRTAPPHPLRGPSLLQPMV